jgi:hypothetical protein
LRYLNCLLIGNPILANVLESNLLAERSAIDVVRPNLSHLDAAARGIAGRQESYLNTKPDDGDLLHPF